MSNVRLISLNGLRNQLREALGADDLLFRRFDLALSATDDKKIEAAMDCLKSYPAETREKVEDTMIRWLFDAKDNSGLADIKPANTLPQ